MKRLFLSLAIALLAFACTENAPDEPNVDVPLTLDVYLEMGYRMDSDAPNDYSVRALAGEGGIIVSGAIRVPNGGYLPSAHAQLSPNNELALAMTFRDFGGVAVPMRVDYRAFITPLTSGSYVLSVTHRRDGGGTVVTTPIVDEIVIVP